MHIRPHRRDDADAIADILAAGWRDAYAGFMPPAVLAPRSDPAFRRAEIAAWLDTDFDAASEAVFVAEAAGTVVGFIYMILGDKGGVGATGHASLLYVAALAQRRGVGRALLGAGAAWLLAMAPGPLALSAFAQNPYRFAYDAMGGREAKRLTAPVGDGAATLESVIYLWDDPRPLVAAQERPGCGCLGANW